MAIGLTNEVLSTTHVALKRLLHLPHPHYLATLYLVFQINIAPHFHHRRVRPPCVIVYN